LICAISESQSELTLLEIALEPDDWHSYGPAHQANQTTTG